MRLGDKQGIVEKDLVPPSAVTPGLTRGTRGEGGGEE